MRMASENKKIAIVMAEALLNQNCVDVKVSNENGDEQITGLITKIDQDIRRVKVSHDKGIMWVPIDDILSLEFSKES